MKGLFFLLAIFLFGMTTKAQPDSSSIYRVLLSDESELVGRIIDSTDTGLNFLSLSGIEVKIPVSQIIEIEQISGRVVDGQLYKTDPNRTRLLFAPTGRALKSGDGYFSIYELFFPSLAVGITDFFSISGGISILTGADKQLFYIAPKFSYETEGNLSFAAGFLYLGIPDEEDAAGILYTVATFGSERNALTIGGGLGLSEGEFSGNPVLMLGGELTVSKSIKLVSENWIFTTEDSNPLISLGVRFFGEHLAADFALIIPTGVETEGFPGIPWVGFAYNF